MFTASQRVYADVLLDPPGPKEKIHQASPLPRVMRFSAGNYLKDLHVMSQGLLHMVLVDNSPHAYGFQIRERVPIESWFDDDNDTELLKLVGFLRHWHFAADDVRSVVGAFPDTCTCGEGQAGHRGRPLRASLLSLCSPHLSPDCLYCSSFILLLSVYHE